MSNICDLLNQVYPYLDYAIVGLVNCYFGYKWLGTGIIGKDEKSSKKEKKIGDMTLEDLASELEIGKSIGVAVLGTGLLVGELFGFEARSNYLIDSNYITDWNWGAYLGVLFGSGAIGTLIINPIVSVYKEINQGKNKYNK
ncbi:hypothetical protein AYK26_05350 [Euryarchaeota archaeon SM23-78]|nr:MAG: hypothetical protein AYK26_05350 [Euryarchaeota archaeon SM23-78]